MFNTNIKTKIVFFLICFCLNSFYFFNNSYSLLSYKFSVKHEMIGESRISFGNSILSLILSDKKNLEIFINNQSKKEIIEKLIFINENFKSQYFNDIFDSFNRYPFLKLDLFAKLIFDALSKGDFTDKERNNILQNTKFTIITTTCEEKKILYRCSLIQIDFFNSSFTESQMSYIDKNFIKNLKFEFERSKYSYLKNYNDKLKLYKKKEYINLLNFFFPDNYHEEILSKYQENYKLDFIVDNYITMGNNLNLVILNLLLICFFFIFNFRVQILNKMNDN